MPSKKLGQRTMNVSITLTDGYGKINTYRVVPLQPVEGAGWMLSKISMVKPVVLERYAVYYTEAAGLSCSCLGFREHSYCKHADGMKALLRGVLKQEEQLVG